MSTKYRIYQYKNDDIAFAAGRVFMKNRILLLISFTI